MAYKLFSLSLLIFSYSMIGKTSKRDGKTVRDSRQRDCCHLPVHFTNGHKSHGWVRPKPGTRI